MPVTSLKELARRATVRNIRRIDNIGDLPLALANSIIARIDNFPQLHRLEQNSPQTVGSPGVREAYMQILKRDIPNLDARMPANWHEMFSPDSDATRWHKIYTKLKRAVDKEGAASAARIASALDGQRREAAEVIDIVNKKPKGISAKAAGWNLNKDMYGKGSGLGFFEKMNRNAVAKKRANMRTPTHKLSAVQRTPVFRAPISLVEEAKAKKALEEENKRAVVGEKRKREEAAGPLHAPGAMKDREERLKRLKMGGDKQKPVQEEQPVVGRLTVADLEGSDEEEHDDLFGENTSKSHRTSTKPVVRASPMKKAASPPAMGGRPMLNGKPVVRRRQEATLFRPVKR